MTDSLFSRIMRGREDALAPGNVLWTIVFNAAFAPLMVWAFGPWMPFASLGFPKQVFVLWGTSVFVGLGLDALLYRLNGKPR